MILSSQTGESYAKREDNLFKRFSDLNLNRQKIINLYRNLGKSGMTYRRDVEVVNFLNDLSKRGQILRFIEFIKEAQNLYYKLNIGSDSYDPLADKYTYSKEVVYGFGGSDKNNEIFIDMFINEITHDYKWAIEREKQTREEANLAYFEKQEREEQPIRDKVTAYEDALEAWNSRDCYWKSSHMKKRPTKEKFGITEEDLKKFDFYRDDKVQRRLAQYKDAMYVFANFKSSFKGFIFGSVVPNQEDYGLTDESVGEFRI